MANKKPTATVKKTSGVVAKPATRKVASTRPAPAKRVPASDVTHSKTMANGQPRPKKRS